MTNAIQYYVEAASFYEEADKTLGQLDPQTVKVVDTRSPAALQKSATECREWVQQLEEVVAKHPSNALLEADQLRNLVANEEAILSLPKKGYSTLDEPDVRGRPRQEKMLEVRVGFPPVKFKVGEINISFDPPPQWLHMHMTKNTPADIAQLDSRHIKDDGAHIKPNDYRRLGGHFEQEARIKVPRKEINNKDAMTMFKKALGTRSAPSQEL